MNKLFEQIGETKVDEKKNHIIVTFPNEDLIFSFKIDRHRIYITHRSHAVIAAVTGRLIMYKSEEIEATNKVFDWLGIEYNIETKNVEPEPKQYEGVISFF